MYIIELILYLNVFNYLMFSFIVPSGFECSIYKSDLPSDLMLVVLETLFEYRTAECRLDWIDLLAFTAFHLSLDGDFNTAELHIVILID